MWCSQLCFQMDLLVLNSMCILFTYWQTLKSQQMPVHSPCLYHCLILQCRCQRITDQFPLLRPCWPKVPVNDWQETMALTATLHAVMVREWCHVVEAVCACICLQSMTNKHEHWRMRSRAAFSKPTVSAACLHTGCSHAAMLPLYLSSTYTVATMLLLVD